MGATSLSKREKQFFGPIPHAKTATRSRDFVDRLDREPFNPNFKCGRAIHAPKDVREWNRCGSGQLVPELLARGCTARTKSTYNAASAAASGPEHAGYETESSLAPAPPDEPCERNGKHPRGGAPRVNLNNNKNWPRPIDSHSSTSYHPIR